MSNSELFSMNDPRIRDASFTLIVDCAEHLINFVYNNQHTSPYDKPEIRVGLAVKILLKSEQNYESKMIEPIICDLEDMLSNEEYVNSFPDPEAKRAAISSELTLMNKYVELDDTITLNTVEHRGKHSDSLF